MRTARFRKKVKKGEHTVIEVEVRLMAHKILRDDRDAFNALEDAIRDLEVQVDGV